MQLGGVGDSLDSLPGEDEDSLVELEMEPTSGRHLHRHLPLVSLF